MANTHIFSQFEPRNFPIRRSILCKSIVLQVAFIFNGAFIKIKHIVRNKSN